MVNGLIIISINVPLSFNKAILVVKNGREKVGREKQRVAHSQPNSE